ncbi:hypothetical protein RCL1_003460 [Eukaryota sp. TZLM3-RCL]
MSLELGDFHFVDEDFVGAVDKYSDAINSNGPSVPLLTHRAAAHLKLQNYQSALDDSLHALRLNKNSGIALYRKGLALFFLNQHQEAFDALELAQECTCPQDVSTWKRRCTSFISQSSSPSIEEKPVVPPQPKPVVQKQTAAPTPVKPIESIPEPMEPAPPVPSSTTSTTASILSESHIYPSKIRYDWLQTANTVTVDIFAPQIKKESVKLNQTPSALEISFPLPTGSDYLLDLELSGTIDPNQTQIRTTPKKVEIVLTKAPATKWKTLEAGETAPTVDPKLYPSSKGSKNWSKIVQEEVAKFADEDKNEDVLAQIFGSGDADTRRAMQKSFLESGGTVLSTNWGEVGKKKVLPYEEEKKLRGEDY